MKETKTATKRASDYLQLKHTYDDFEPVVQNICNEEQTFMLDGCEVSYKLEDLDPTDYSHVYEIDCDEYDIVITFDMEDGLPDHANMVSGSSEHWAELIHVPDMEEEGEEGCLFVEVSSLDIDPAKVEEDYLQHPRKLLGANSPKRSFFADGQNDFFPIEKPERRELNSCSQYNVIKLGIVFDSAFCQQVGGSEGQAHAVIHSVIATMNQWYMASPLCFYIYSTYIGGTCNSSQDPIPGVIAAATQHCMHENDLTATFEAHVNGNFHGSDAMHLVFGGEPASMQGWAGCAFQETLCTSQAVGTNNFGPDYSQHDMALLLAHELGHTLSIGDFYPEDKTYIMGDGSAGFKPDRITKMKEYVARRQQEKPGCAGISASVGGGTPNPNTTPTQAPNSDGDGDDDDDDDEA